METFYYFITAIFLKTGISAVRYFAVGAELVTLARFYVLSASANFIFSTTVTIFAITQGYSDMAVMFGVMAALSIAEAESILKDALSNGNIISIVDNGVTKAGNASYEIIIDAGKIIGTRGENLVKIVISSDGGMLSAYPIRQ